MSDRGLDERSRTEKGRLQRLRERLADVDPTSVPEEFLHLARSVLDVNDVAMTCDECQARLPIYVDAEVGSLAVGQLYPEVKRHLELCSECEVEYLEMLDLAIVEDAGELPVPEEFPAPGLAFLPSLSLSDYVHSVAEELVATTAPELLSDLRAITDVFFERVAGLDEKFTLGSGWAPAMGFGADEVPEALKLLAATYVATRNLTNTLSPEEIEAQARTGQLQETLRRQAKDAAQTLELSAQQAQAFADRYAELTRDPQVLQELATSQNR